MVICAMNLVIKLLFVACVTVVVLPVAGIYARPHRGGTQPSRELAATKMEEDKEEDIIMEDYQR